MTDAMHEFSLFADSSKNAGSNKQFDRSFRAGTRSNSFAARSRELFEDVVQQHIQPRWSGRAFDGLHAE